MRGHRGYNICPWLKSGEARNMWKILSRILLQSTQAYDKERKSNFAALFEMWHWCKESDSTMSWLWARKRKTKTRENPCGTGSA